MTLNMNRLLREPFLHFLLLGALIFLYYELSGSEEGEAASTLINVTAEDIELLRQQWRKQHGEEFYSFVQCYCHLLSFSLQVNRFDVLLQVLKPVHS